MGQSQHWISPRVLSLTLVSQFMIWKLLRCRANNQSCQDSFSICTRQWKIQNLCDSRISLSQVEEKMRWSSKLLRYKKSQKKNSKLKYAIAVKKKYYSILLLMLTPLEQFQMKDLKLSHQRTPRNLWLIFDNLHSLLKWNEKSVRRVFWLKTLICLSHKKSERIFKRFSKNTLFSHAKLEDYKTSRCKIHESINF